MAIDKPKLDWDEARKVVLGKTAPKVLEEDIEAKIADVEYIAHKGILTICIITMKNGFMVHGVSAPASPENFDSEVGKTYAYKNAFQQLWPLEGYLLRQRLSEGYYDAKPNDAA